MSLIIILLAVFNNFAIRRPISLLVPPKQKTWLRPWSRLFVSVECISPISSIRRRCNCSSVTQAAARCLGSSLLGPCGNWPWALISLRSGPAAPPSQAEQLTAWTLACYYQTSYTEPESTHTLDEQVTYDTYTACIDETMFIARIMGLTTIVSKS